MSIMSQCSSTRQVEIHMVMATIKDIVVALATADHSVENLHVNFWAVYSRWTVGISVGDCAPYVLMYDNMRMELHK